MVDAPGAMGKLNLDEVEEWLSILYAAADGFVHICSTLNWAGQTFSPDDTSAMRAYVATLDAQGAKGIYARVTTLKRPQVKGRGSDSDSHTFTGLWADIDISGPGHKTTNLLPPDVTQAMGIVTEAELPEPTYWIHSGGGLYPWWRLDNPFEVTDPEALAHTQDISARWQAVLRDAAERRGYSYGPVGDLSRVMRIPGTVNRKIEGNPVRCVLLDSFSSGQLYSTADLKAALEAAEAHAARLNPPPAPPRQPVCPDRGERVGDRPGDDLAARMSWAEILEPHGYQLDRRQGEEEYWVRPGKHRRDGHSCTTNYGGSELLYVFSTEMAGFEANESYSKFATWSILNGFGRDWKAAAKALRDRYNYGRESDPSPTLTPLPLSKPADGGGTPAEGVDGAEPSEAPRVRIQDFDLTELGAAEALAATAQGQFRYVGKLNTWMRWNGVTWEEDETATVVQAAHRVAKDIVEGGKQLQRADESHKTKACQCPGCALVKHGTSLQSRAHTKGLVAQFGDLAGVATSFSSFDAEKKWVTVGNGTLNLETMELSPFDRQRLLTKKLGASYNPQAKAPKFEAFMKQVLPSASVRDYVQRALGYTLTGENDQRALFLVHGESGTGKSQFLTIFNNLFGDFGGTAEAKTFRLKRSDSTHDLHSLRGQRFVTTSETSDSSKLDEELVKRITGGDEVTSRALYQGFISWRPEFTIWMATNFPPKMSASDGAIWARYKPIHFAQVFQKTEADVPNLGQKIFDEEADGILNWLLEGLKAYRERGLGEPQEVLDQVAEHRLESDTVAQFIASSLEEERLVEDADARVKSSVLYMAYERWCAQERIQPVGLKRFGQSLSGRYEKIRSNGTHYGGLRLAEHVGLLGTMG